MSIKNSIYTYFTEKGVHGAKEIMCVLNLQRPIVDKYLSLLVREEKIYRISRGKYSKANEFNDCDIKKIENNKLCRMTFLNWLVFIIVQFNVLIISIILTQRLQGKKGDH